MKKTIKQAVILAGGLGTRLKPFTDKHPKPMYKFQNKPFIEYLILQIKDFGIDNVVLLLGYRADEIIKYFKNGEKYGIHIQYSVTPEEYETGSRLLSAYDVLQKDFLLMYCDNYCPIDFEKLCDDYITKEADIQITVYANKDGYTKNNLNVGTDGRIENYDKLRTASDLNGVDIGYALVKKSVLDYMKEYNEKILNFEKTVYPIVISYKKMYATITEHRYYSIGSWERIKLTEQFFHNSKTVFLDRDGTLNVRPPKACYIEKKEEFKWLKGAIEAVKYLKDKGYRLILITNQPGIARGRLTEDILAGIHDKMQADLLEKTGYMLDAIYYCPHNWDEGCACRKPKPGMLYQAQKEYSLNLRECILIGDDERDIEAGNAAGCICYQVTEKQSLLNIVQKNL